MIPAWKTSTRAYAGFIMACAPGTHETAMDLLRERVAPCPAIDLGACSGAFLKRLQDAGFTDLSGVEYNDRIELPGVAKFCIDLNTAFASQLPRKYGLVVCTEVIEHLDSPRHFLKQVHAITEDDGYLLLSLPNIEHWMGRVKFLLFGEHWGFGAWHYRNMRHINPITYEQMKLMLQEIGFRLVADATGGDFSGPLRRITYAPARLAFRVLGGPRTDGDSAIYLAQKTAPDTDLLKHVLPA